MPDKFSPEVRSNMMSKIHGRDTGPEVKIRKALFNKGFRYRIYSATLPGTPDIIFPKYRAIILFNGCFWHGHSCYLFNWPKTNTEFWVKKINSTRARDLSTMTKLNALGWRVLIVWGCALKGKLRIDFEDLINQISAWLILSESNFEISHNSRPNITR